MFEKMMWEAMIAMAPANPVSAENCRIAAEHLLEEWVRRFAPLQQKYEYDNWKEQCKSLVSK